MTIKINELIIKAKIEKDNGFLPPVSNNRPEDERITIKKTNKIVSLNKINRER